MWSDNSSKRFQRIAMCKGGELYSKIQKSRTRYVFRIHVGAAALHLGRMRVGSYRVLLVSGRESCPLHACYETLSALRVSIAICRAVISTTIRATLFGGGGGNFSKSEEELASYATATILRKYSCQVAILFLNGFPHITFQSVLRPNRDTYADQTLNIWHRMTHQQKFVAGSIFLNSIS